MQKLEHRTAAVTGAASGIGLALVEVLVANGMQVVMADIDKPLLDRIRTRPASAPRHSRPGIDAVAISTAHDVIIID